MASEKHGTRLEWIIIWLIAIEVLFGIRHLYVEWVSEETEATMLAELKKAAETRSALLAELQRLRTIQENTPLQK